VGELSSRNYETFHDLLAQKHLILSVSRDECDFGKALTTKVERYGNLIEIHGK
jgi:hypothetical protein